MLPWKHAVLLAVVMELTTSVQRGLQLTGYTTQLTWNDAACVCRRSGSRLLMMKNIGDRDVLETLMNMEPWNATLSTELWLGLYDPSHRGVNVSYVWHDGDQLGSFTQWYVFYHPKEPNNQLHDYCIHADFMVPYGETECHFWWKTNNCASQYPFVCEKTIDCWMEEMADVTLKVSNTSSTTTIVKSKHSSPHRCSVFCLNVVVRRYRCWAVVYNDKLCTVFLSDNLFALQDEYSYDIVHDMGSLLMVKKCFKVSINMTALMSQNWSPFPKPECFSPTTTSATTPTTTTTTPTTTTTTPTTTTTTPATTTTTTTPTTTTTTARTTPTTVTTTTTTPSTTTTATTTSTPDTSTSTTSITTATTTSTDIPATSERSPDKSSEGYFSGPLLSKDPSDSELTSHATRDFSTTSTTSATTITKDNKKSDVTVSTKVSDLKFPRKSIPATTSAEITSTSSNTVDETTSENYDVRHRTEAATTSTADESTTYLTSDSTSSSTETVQDTTFDNPTTTSTASELTSTFKAPSTENVTKYTFPTTTSVTSGTSNEMSTTQNESATTTATTTETTDVTTSSNRTSTCRCFCVVDKTKEQQLDEVKQIVHKLTVVKNSTSAFKRKFKSASDSRRSAAAVGGIGIGIVVIMLTPFVVLDVSNLVSAVVVMYKKKFSERKMPAPDLIDVTYIKTSNSSPFPRPPLDNFTQTESSPGLPTVPPVKTTALTPPEKGSKALSLTQQDEREGLPPLMKVKNALLLTQPVKGEGLPPLMKGSKALSTTPPVKKESLPPLVKGDKVLSLTPPVKGNTLPPLERFRNKCESVKRQSQINRQQSGKHSGFGEIPYIILQRHLQSKTAKNTVGPAP